LWQNTSVILMLIRIWIRLFIFMLIHIRILMFDFCSQQWQFILFYLSRQCDKCHNFKNFGRIIEIFWKKYSWASQ
jgi:hypothetical protein